MARPTTTRRRVATTGALMAVIALVIISVVAGLGADPVTEAPTTTTLPFDATAPSPGPDAGAVPGGADLVPVVSVDGTLERSGDDLVGRATLTNQGPATVWVPVDRVGSARPRLVPAAAGGGTVDLGWVVPPTPAEGAGVDAPAVVFAPVEPGSRVELAATDAPPPPEALVDVAGAAVEVESYRLCVDAFADAALPTDARGPVADDPAAVAVEVDAIDGESTRTCGPVLAAA